MNKALRILQIFSDIPDYTKKNLDMQYCLMRQCGAMDKAQYKRLKDRLNREYMANKRRLDEAQAALESEFERKIGSLDLTWEMIKADVSPETLSIADMMREAIAHLQEPFQCWQVYEKMKTDHPEVTDTLKMKTVSGHLTRMLRRHELAEVEKGKGTTPSSYRREAIKTK